MFAASGTVAQRDLLPLRVEALREIFAQEIEDAVVLAQLALRLQDAEGAARHRLRDRIYVVRTRPAPELMLDVPVLGHLARNVRSVGLFQQLNQLFKFGH